jgi:hypothetical protein
MAVSSNQKVGELARIAYLALLHAESELGEETNAFDGWLIPLSQAGLYVVDGSVG